MGFFSWNTSDTNEPVRNRYTDDGPTPCKVLFPDRDPILCLDYEGYGDFTDANTGETIDFYEEVDRLNGGTGDSIRGIHLESDAEKDESIILPRIVSVFFDGTWKDAKNSTNADCQGYF